MKLITTQMKYNWDKDKSDEFKEDIAKKFKLWTGTDEIITYRDIVLTEIEYLEYWEILDSILYVREIQKD